MTYCYFPNWTNTNSINIKYVFLKAWNNGIVLNSIHGGSLLLTSMKTLSHTCPFWNFILWFLESESNISWVRPLSPNITSLISALVLAPSRFPVYTWILKLLFSPSLKIWSIWNRRAQLQSLFSSYVEYLIILKRTSIRKTQKNVFGTLTGSYFFNSSPPVWTSASSLAEYLEDWVVDVDSSNDVDEFNDLSEPKPLRGLFELLLLLYRYRIS